MKVKQKRSKYALSGENVSTVVFFCLLGASMRMCVVRTFSLSKRHCQMYVRVSMLFSDLRSHTIHTRGKRKTTVSIFHKLLTQFQDVTLPRLSLILPYLKVAYCMQMTLYGVKV